MVQFQSGNSVPATSALIGVDWGTSSFRAYLISGNGELLEQVTGPAGIMSVDDGDFGAVLRRACAEWIESCPGLPILMCGMIGSRQGWKEVPYLRGEIGASELAAAVTPIENEQGRIRIVPGMQALSFDGGPDVMRGEETILVGAIASGAPQTALYCLPGTHSKWVSVSDGRIGSFSTFLTGELFAILCERSLLSALIADGSAVSEEQRNESFQQGLAMASKGTHLLHKLFSIRAKFLTEAVESCIVEEVLSGLLIGTELVSVSRQLQEHAGGVILLASGDISERYQKALVHMGHAPEVHEAEAACMKGLHSIAAEAGLMSSTRVMTAPVFG